MFTMWHLALGLTLAITGLVGCAGSGSDNAKPVFPPAPIPTLTKPAALPAREWTRSECARIGYDGSQCAPYVGWIQNDGAVGLRVPATLDANKNLVVAEIFDRFIGKVLGERRSTCADINTFFADPGLVSEHLVVVLPDQAVDVSASAAKEATDQLTFQLRTSLGARFTPTMEVQFRTTFETALEKTLKMSAGTALRIEWYEMRLEDGFKDHGVHRFEERFPSFKNCEGSKLVTGIFGYLLKTSDYSSLSQTASNISTAVNTAFSASADLLPHLEASVSSSLVASATDTLASKYAVSSGLLSPEFNVLWYATTDYPRSTPPASLPSAASTDAPPNKPPTAKK